MTVGNGSTCTGVYSGAIPSNGVVYVSNGSCSTAYTPFNDHLPEHLRVRERLRERQLLRPADDRRRERHHRQRQTSPTHGGGLLGLIANNFVRVYHPCSSGTNGSRLADQPRRSTPRSSRSTTRSSSTTTTAATQLGTLTVNGAIAQKFRGPVGTFGGGGGTGYSKNYVYDDRLRYLEPPSFIEPIQSAWVIGRETIG